MMKASCPSCGAELEFKNRASLWVVCEYCQTLAVRKDMNLEAVGKVADLAQDGSVMQLGAKGVYKKKPFEVVGRLQLQFPQGYWNEWFLDFGGSESGWLGEAMGDYMVSFVVPSPPRVPGYSQLGAGFQLNLNGVVMVVTDRRAARCISGEGELPFQVRGGYDAQLVDLTGPGGRFGTIDYSEEPPIVFVGEYVELESLAMQGLREIEGW